MFSLSTAHQNQFICLVFERCTARDYLNVCLAIVVAGAVFVVSLVTGVLLITNKTKQQQKNTKNNRLHITSERKINIYRKLVNGVVNEDSRRTTMTSELQTVVEKKTKQKNKSKTERNCQRKHTHTALNPKCVLILGSHRLLRVFFLCVHNWFN